MQRRNRKAAPEVAAPRNDPEPSDITLRYRNVMQILVDMGFRGETGEKTFNDYIKSLRRLGVPVWSDRAPHEGHFILYSFENVMDLVLALSLRVYNGVPDAVLRKLVEARPRLYPLYRQAYRERETGLGSPVQIRDGTHHQVISGVFLDLRINHAGGKLVGFGPPEALSPADAIDRFARSRIASRAFAPLCLSAICEEVVARANEVMRRESWRPKGRNEANTLIPSKRGEHLR